LKGSAYGRGSVNQAMLEQGGVSIGTYSVLEGTQIEIISPTRFVIKYVHREAGGCVRVVSYYYELAEQNETACQHIIEILPEEQPEVVSTPVPLPPVDEDVPYVVTMPVLPDSCTADTRPPDDFTEAQLALDEDGGSLTVNYGSGSFTTYKYLNSQFSFVDHRQGVFRLDLTLYQDYLTWRWFKTGANGAMCTVEGELRPASPTVPEGAAPAPDSPMAVITNNPYTVIWTPVEQFCPPDVFAGMNTFTQASLTAQADGFEIDYGTGSYTLRDESGAGFYSYMHFGDNGSSTLLSLNSHTATAFSLLFQQSDASGQMCMANVEITQG
jgi:hypothetical protein